MYIYSYVSICYIYLNACMRVCMYARTFVHAHFHTRVRACVCTNIRIVINARICVCNAWNPFSHKQMWIHARTRSHTHTHTHTHAHTHTHSLLAWSFCGSFAMQIDTHTHIHTIYVQGASGSTASGGKVVIGVNKYSHDTGVCIARLETGHVEMIW